MSKRKFNESGSFVNKALSNVKFKLESWICIPEKKRRNVRILCEFFYLIIIIFILYIYYYRRKQNSDHEVESVIE